MCLVPQAVFGQTSQCYSVSYVSEEYVAKMFVSHYWAISWLRNCAQRIVLCHLCMEIPFHELNKRSQK